MKTDNVSDATVSFPDIQEETPEDITTEDTIIIDETDETRDTETSQQGKLRQTLYQINKK